jgi:hypothetical protein
MLVSSEELRVALRGLSAWFERVCIDGDYVTTAPAEGIDALHHITQQSPDLSTGHATVAWWSVRVAEDIVKCRQLLRPSDTIDDIDLDVAFARLELALYRGEQVHPEMIEDDRLQLRPTTTLRTRHEENPCRRS